MVLGKSMGELALTDDEWHAINEAMGDTVEKEVESNRDMKKGMDALRAKGIVPDKKMKWLIWLAAILGLGAVTTLGIAPIVAAAGAGAKVTGGTLWSGMR